MGKQGPCRHCGVTSTPLWRNGPPDKPVLCNACGSRWRTKGSLTNYTPMHARDDIDAEEPRASKLKPPTLKLKEQKQPKKNPSHITMENGPFSDQNFRKMGDPDLSNRSGSGSALSYSESCAPYGTADASEMTASAQSHAWESLVPSKRRSCVARPKPSQMEKLAKDLNSIMHEEQLLYLSGSSEEDLIYHSATPVDSFEMGYGSMLLRPNSKSLEEESEASSIPADNKSYITSESYSGSVSFVYSESKATSNQNVITEQPKKFLVQTSDNARRANLHTENQDTLENANSPLVSLHMEGKDSEETRVKTSASNRLTKSTMNPLKRPHDTHFQSSVELRGTMRSPKRVFKYGDAMGLKCQVSFMPKPGNGKDLACSDRALNLFMLPPDKLSMLVPPQYANNESDQDLLLDVPLNARHPEAELLCQPSQLSSVAHSSTSEGGNAGGEGRLKQP
uniref:GATA-type domain-containing protein n=1 Tax=Oryza meridionalis TaxID=40149 RepID=A0A0E0D6N2_9ORYZ